MTYLTEKGREVVWSHGDIREFREHVHCSWANQIESCDVRTSSEDLH